MTTWFRKYLLPGMVFQSIAIAGGYGTGRELAEFFLRYGPINGLLGLLIPTMLIISLCSIMTFELARIYRAYDYRSFLRLLLGRAWFLYEIIYLTSVLLILAVIGAATGTLLVEAVDVPAIVGTMLLLGAIAFLAFKGSRVIEGVMSVWSFVLYAVYLSVFVLSMLRYGNDVAEQFSLSDLKSGWIISGLRYGALQLLLLPAVLFATTHITKRKEAIVAGALVGPIMILPAVMFFVAMVAHYPTIMDRPVPVNLILQALDSPFLQIVFPIVLVGTFIETGTGMIHAFNERIATALSAIGRIMPPYIRPVTAVALVVCATLMSRFGLIDLIAVGYGTLTWIALAVLILPLLGVGAWRIFHSSQNNV